MSGIRKMFELAGTDSVNMGLGEPDFSPAPHIVEALGDAARAGHNNYGPSLGIPDLRAAIAERQHGDNPDLTANNVIVTASATEALMAVNLTYVDRGQEVLIPDPGFVLYASHAQIAGATPVPYDLSQENGFEPNPEEIQEKITKDTAMLVLNSPANPTGGVTDGKTLKAIAEICEDANVLLVSDEVYDTMVFDGEHESILRYTDDAIWTNSFSKSYCMTGWRLGMLIAPEPIVKQLEVMHYYTIACPPTPIQHAALAALTGPQEHVAEMRDVFRTRRDAIVERLQKIRGMHISPPKGAFYAMPTYDFQIPSQDLAMDLARKGLICAPGSTFGANGEHHLRFSYATSLDEIHRGMDILEAHCETLELPGA